MKTTKLIEAFKTARSNENSYEERKSFSQIFEMVKPDIVNTIRKNYSLYMGVYGEDLIQAAASGLFNTLEMFNENKDNFGLFVRTITESSCRNFIRQLKAYTEKKPPT